MSREPAEVPLALSRPSAAAISWSAGSVDCPRGNGSLIRLTKCAIKRSIADTPVLFYSCRFMPIDGCITCIMIGLITRNCMGYHSTEHVWVRQGFSLMCYRIRYVEFLHLLLPFFMNWTYNKCVNKFTAVLVNCWLNWLLRNIRNSNCLNCQVSRSYRPTIGPNLHTSRYNIL